MVQFPDSFTPRLISIGGKPVNRSRLGPRGSSRDQLIRAAQRGGITLVLGAGISMPSGIPDWNTLAKRIWRDVFKDKPSPWSQHKLRSSPRELPQFLPIIFELAYKRLGESRFTEILKGHMYKKVKYPFQIPSFARSNESLAVLGRLLVAEYKRGAERRITSVITLNADDFIEQAVDCISGPHVVGVINRSTHRFLPQAPKGPIPIYHVHGFLPSDLHSYLGPRPDKAPKHMLVFTDLQYWSTSATASSFANRVVSSALSEGQCVFIGVSMRDINLLRWLALRTLDRESDQIDFSQQRLLRLIDSETENQLLEQRKRLIKVQHSLQNPLLSRVRSIDKAFEVAERSDAGHAFPGEAAFRQLFDLTSDILDSLRVRTSVQSGPSKTKPSHRGDATPGQERLLRQIAQLTTNQVHELLELLNSVRGTIVDPMGSASTSLDVKFRRHFWIRPSSIDPSGFLSEFLSELRGVQSVEIEDWRGDSFAKLIRSCFPKKSKVQSRK
jgi:hypothetical protein